MYISATTYKNYKNAQFIDDFASVLFHIANIFDDLESNFMGSILYFGGYIQV